jgi:hypothetical protein
LAIEYNRKSNAAHAYPVEWQGLARSLRGDIGQGQRIHEQVRRGESIFYVMLLHKIRLRLFHDAWSLQA